MVYLGDVRNVNRRVKRDMVRKKCEETESKDELENTGFCEAGTCKAFGPTGIMESNRFDCYSREES